MIISPFSRLLLSIGSIVFVDLVLSGDNALVIGSVAARVPQGRRRRIAFVAGGLGAVVMRIIFTLFATFLLAIPYLQLVGGILVLIIAIRLLLDMPSSVDEQLTESLPNSNGDADKALPALSRVFLRWIYRRKKQPQAVRKWDLVIAIMTITIADISMSLDNIIAIGAIAHNQTIIVVLGLFLSITLLLVGSAMVAELISHVPQIIILASVILAWVSADLIWNDLRNLPFIKAHPSFQFGLYALALIVVLLIALVTQMNAIIMLIAHFRHVRAEQGPVSRDRDEEREPVSR